MKKKKIIEQLAAENAVLRKEIGILVDAPDSPEAAAIKIQWHFAQQIEKAYATGGPIDTPKLLGLWGQLTTPPQPEPLYPVPKNVEDTKTMLVNFFRYLHTRGADLAYSDDPMYYVNGYMVHIANQRKKQDEGV